MVCVKTFRFAPVVCVVFSSLSYICIGGLCCVLFSECGVTVFSVLFCTPGFALSQFWLHFFPGRLLVNSLNPCTGFPVKLDRMSSRNDKPKNEEENPNTITSAKAFFDAYVPEKKFCRELLQEATSLTRRICIILHLEALHLHFLQRKLGIMDLLISLLIMVFIPFFTNHNTHHYLGFFRSTREAIKDGKFDYFRKTCFLLLSRLQWSVPCGPNSAVTFPGAPRLKPWYWWSWPVLPLGIQWHKQRLQTLGYGAEIPIVFIETVFYI